MVSIPPDTSTAADEDEDGAEEEEGSGAGAPGQTARAKMSCEWGRWEVLYTHSESLGAARRSAAAATTAVDASSPTPPSPYLARNKASCGVAAVRDESVRLDKRAVRVSRRAKDAPGVERERVGVSGCEGPSTWWTHFQAGETRTWCCAVCGCATLRTHVTRLSTPEAKICHAGEWRLVCLEVSG